MLVFKEHVPTIAPPKWMRIAESLSCLPTLWLRGKERHSNSLVSNVVVFLVLFLN